MMGHKNYLWTEWPCTIEITWVELVRHDPGSYKHEILANRGQRVCKELPYGVIKVAIKGTRLIYIMLD